MNERAQDRHFRISETRFVVTNMAYPQCAITIERLLKGNPYVAGADVSFATGQAVIGYDPEGISREELQDIINRAGYECLLHDHTIIDLFDATVRPKTTPGGERTKSIRDERGERSGAARQRGTVAEGGQRSYMDETMFTLRSSLVVTASLTLVIFLTSPAAEAAFGFTVKLPFRPDIAHFVLATLAIFYGGNFFFSAALRSLKQHTANMAILVSVALLAIYLYSVAATFIAGSAPLFLVACMTLVIVLLGRWAEVAVRLQGATETRWLHQLTPQKATLVTGSGTSGVRADTLQAGDVVVVKQGERVPADGVIIEGKAYISQPQAFGKSAYRAKRVGDVVVGSTVNIDGVFKMRVIRAGRDTFFANIVRVAEAAERSRLPIQKRMDRLASNLVPVTLIVGAMAFAFWQFVSTEGVLFALVVAASAVLIASPDALALASPIAFVSGMRQGSDRGILIKSAKAVQRAAAINTVLFNKEMLVDDMPEVSDIVHVGRLTEPGFLRLIAGFESRSPRGYSRAIVKVAEQQIGHGFPMPTEYKVIPGYGVMGKVETRCIAVGNKHLMLDLGIDVTPVTRSAEEIARKGNTVLYVALDGRIEGVFGLTNRMRPDAKEAVKRLRAIGVSTGLFTDDEETTAGVLARRLGADAVYADVLPQERPERIKMLQRHGRRVGMVGDGMVDAPALIQSDLGIAINSGLDITAESGEILLLNDSPVDVVEAIALSRRIVRKVRQNVFWAVAYNAIALVVAAGVLYPLLGILIRPEIAAIAMSASTVAVILNSLRLRSVA